MRCVAFRPFIHTTQVWEARNIHVASIRKMGEWHFPLCPRILHKRAKNSLNYLMASVQECAQPSVFEAQTKVLHQCKIWKMNPRLCTHSHPHTYVGFCPGQDAGNAPFCWHLLEGKSSLEAVVWHQHSKTDTIYHRPLSTETFITSWQENLVENNHWGFDNSLDASSTPHLDGALPWFTAHYQ